MQGEITYMNQSQSSLQKVKFLYLTILNDSHSASYTLHIFKNLNTNYISFA